MANQIKAVADHDNVPSGFYVSVNGREEAHLARLESSLFCSAVGCRHQPAFAYCVDLYSKLETPSYSEQLPVASIRAAAGYEVPAQAKDGLKMHIIHWGKDQHSLLIGPISRTHYEQQLAELGDKLAALGVAKCRKQLICFTKEE